MENLSTIQRCLTSSLFLTISHNISQYLCYTSLSSLFLTISHNISTIGKYKSPSWSAISHNISSGRGSSTYQKINSWDQHKNENINLQLSVFPNVTLSSPLSILSLINVDWLMSCYRIEGWLQNWSVARFRKKRIFRLKQNTAGFKAIHRLRSNTEAQRPVTTTQTLHFCCCVIEIQWCHTMSYSTIQCSTTKPYTCKLVHWPPHTGNALFSHCVLVSVLFCHKLPPVQFAICRVQSNFNQLSEQAVSEFESAVWSLYLCFQVLGSIS